MKAMRVWFSGLLTAPHQAKPHGTEQERTLRLPSKKLPFCFGCRGQRAARKGKVSLIVDHQQPDGKISPCLSASPIGETGSTARRKKNLKHDRKCQQYIIIPMSFSFDDLLLAFHWGWRHVFVTASPLPYPPHLPPPPHTHDILPSIPQPPIFCPPPQPARYSIPR